MAEDHGDLFQNAKQNKKPQVAQDSKSPESPNLIPNWSEKTLMLSLETKSNSCTSFKQLATSVMILA